MTPHTEIDYAFLITGLLLTAWLLLVVFVWDGAWSTSTQPCFPAEHMLWQREGC